MLLLIESWACSWLEAITKNATTNTRVQALGAQAAALLQGIKLYSQELCVQLAWRVQTIFQSGCAIFPTAMDESLFISRESVH